MAERLRTGLQIREARFDSGSGLQALFLINSKQPYAARMLARNLAISIFSLSEARLTDLASSNTTLAT